AEFHEESMMPKEVKVARVQDFQDGDMREVALGDAKLVLARVKGKFYALHGECTHYGGPLAEGALNGPRVVCPWHHAAFDLTTGGLLEPPALDHPTCFTVRVDGDDVYIQTPDKLENRSVPPMVKRDPAEGRTFVILGAGAAGNAAAETLRQDGFTGRPNLSKGYLSGEAGPETLPWREEKFYQDYDIELLFGRRAAAVDVPQKTITLADGASLAYDGLLLATGGLPRPLAAPGAGLGNVFTLRTPEDADQIIRAAVPGAKAVCIGASFIGMEAAASLTKRGLAVTVAGRGSIPFERQLGPEIGRLLMQVHEEKGVSFRLGRKVARLVGDDRVRQVVLDDGAALEADLVVVGLGAVPATGFIRGLSLEPDGSIRVDQYLKASESVYAAGDIARFPDWRTGEPIRIEHWRLAAQHGRTAAHNLAGKPAAFAGVPFFWSEHFDQFLQYVGYAATWDELIIQGDLAARNFLALYVKGGRILAAAGLNHDRQLAALSELMRMDKLPAPDAVRREARSDFAAQLKALQT
ncbi:MAG: FAD-dependent oxidoreductase, partial [Desulfobaccales bacterium]